MMEHLASTTTSFVESVSGIFRCRFIFSFIGVVIAFEVFQQTDVDVTMREKGCAGIWHLGFVGIQKTI